VHVPDGYLSPATCAALYAGAAPFWFVALRRLERTLHTRLVPRVSLFAAFSFVVMMFNIPLPGGTTGHAVGMALAAIVLGPAGAILAISTALIIQAFFFGDGGITAIGANCLNMAVIMPFVGFYLYRLVAGNAPRLGRRVAAAGVASYVAIVVASIAAGVEFGLQPLLAHTSGGQPLYAPYPLSVAVPAMAIEHLLFFGFVEAFVTMGIVAVLARQDSALLEMKPAAKPLRWLWAGLAGLVLLTPIGVLAPGTAWGEWGAAELKPTLGFVPAGLQKLGALWTAAIPDYVPPFIANPLVGYVVAALLGSALVIGVTWLIARLLSRKAGDGPSTPAPTAP